MSNPFHVTVAAVIEQDGRYLMVEELIDGKRFYNQPAGHLEPDESLVDAVIREALEETARPFTPDGLVGIYRWLSPGGETFLRFTFRGDAGEAEAGRPLDPEISRTLWLSRQEVADRAGQLRSPLVLRSIDDARRGSYYPLTLLNDLA
jgi:8-oxo-dGTP pyrophosphatase MutT (NUDIX family)